MKKHILTLLRNFGLVFGAIWLFLESSSGFGWLDTSKFGLWGYLYLVIVCLLVTSIITYVEFYYRGKDERVKEVVEVKFSEIKEFHGSYRLTNWNQLICSANNNITICGYYFDTWFTWTKGELTDFLRKPNSKLQIIVADPKDERRLTEINRLFPQYSSELVKSKIAGTKTKVTELLSELQLATDKFDFYHYPNHLNYSYILIDNRFLYLTIYEMERIEKSDCFSITIDIEKNDEVKKFILKENRLILKNSQKT